MNLNLSHPLRRRLMDADLDAGGTDTGTVDRGDDFVPTDPEAEAAAAAGKGGAGEAAAAAALEAELAEKAKTKAAGKEPAEGEETDEDKADKAKGKDTRIPLSRHEAVLNKEREKRADLERQLAQFQNGKAVAAVNQDITASEEAVLKLEKEYATLLTDGEIDKATAVMLQIRKAEREMTEAKSDLKIQAAEIRAVERTRYGVALDRIEASFPVLNPDHEDYDEAIEEEVGELKSAYELKGLTPTAALQKAVKYIVGAKTVRQEDATTVTPKVDATDAAAVAAARKVAAIKKTVAAVEATPASTAKVGMDSDKAGGALDAKAVMKMSQADFAKLPEEVLSRMRGDTIG